MISSRTTDAWDELEAIIYGQLINSCLFGSETNHRKVSPRSASEFEGHKFSQSQFASWARESNRETHRLQSWLVLGLEYGDCMMVLLTFLEASWSSFNSFMILLLLSIALALLQLLHYSAINCFVLAPSVKSAFKFLWIKTHLKKPHRLIRQIWLTDRQARCWSVPTHTLTTLNYSLTSFF